MNVTKLGFIIFYLLLFNSILGQETKNILEKTDVDTIVVPKKEVLIAKVDYKSLEQYHEIKKRKSFLVTEASVSYTDMEILADYIEINWQTGEIYAVGQVDSTGNIIVPTTFKQGDRVFLQESFRFNFNTKQGIAYNVKTAEGDGMLTGEQVKRKNDSISLLRGAEYTTDKYYIQGKEDRPDYVLRTEVAKLIDRKEKGKTIITGPIQMRIYDVPTPILAPFALIPLSDKRKAGILIPSFGEREDVGFYLANGGLYMPIGDVADFTLTADFYTRGSWGVHASSQYKKRYKYGGNLGVDYENLVRGIKGLSSYSQTKLYRINWTHRQDQKMNPSLIFTSSVNISSSKYYRNAINNFTIFNGTNVTNTTSSSISVIKTFEKLPFSVSLNLNHSQNNNTTVNNIQMSLPQLTVNMTRLYPFATKIGSKKGLLKSMGVDYNLNLQNNLVTNEDDFFTSNMFNNLKTGLQHSVGIQSGATLFNYFPLTVNFAYKDVWVLKTIRKNYNTTTNTVEENSIKGFSSYRTFSIGTFIETNLYGQLNFKTKRPDGKPLIKAIRHVLTPRVGVSYQPDFSSSFWGYYDTYTNAAGAQVNYSIFEGGIYGAPGSGLQANLNYGLVNNLEMKVRSSKTDSLAYQKVKIFDYLNLNGSYNFAADSLNFSPVAITAASSLLDQKFKVNYSFIIDPYDLYFSSIDDQIGDRVNKLGRLRLSSFNVNFSYAISNATFQPKEKKESGDLKNTKKGKGRYEVFSFGSDGYARYAIPWNLSFNFNYNSNKSTNRTATVTTSLGINGSIQLTPYWAITAHTSYDFEHKKFTYTRFQFTRDLRSFTINFSWAPFGDTQAWNFFIGIKSQILGDALKYEDRNFAGGTTL